MANRAKETVASLKDVFFSYDGERDVLHSVSLQVERGEIYAIVGPNGAGKSTIVNLLIGAFEPRAGAVVVAGYTHPEDRARHIACVQQQLSLFPHLSVAENLFVVTDAWTRANARSFAREQLITVGLDVPLDGPVGALPFPSRQKIEIARALAMHPVMLLLDEPTSALDADSRDELYKVLRQLSAAGTTIVLVSHDSHEVGALGAQPIFVVGGRVVDARLTDDWATVPWEHSPRPSDEVQGDAVVEIEFSNGLAGDSLTVSLARGTPTVLSFDDALERTEAIRAIAFGDARFHARGRTSQDQPWLRLPGASSFGNLRVITGDKQRDNLFPELNVRDNAMLLACPDALVRTQGQEEGVLRRLVAAAGVMYPSAIAPLSSLSGGNQQRLLLASVIESRPSVLVAEEPLLGLDEASHARIEGLLMDYVARGGRLLVVTCFPHLYSASGLYREHFMRPRVKGGGELHVAT